jgi:hypothetical protein
MKKIIYDPVSKHDIEINLVGNTASMCANGHFIKETIRPSDLSMAKVALAKRDLNGFGSFFE